jgi:hypothetical protein
MRCFRSVQRRHFHGRNQVQARRGRPSALSRRLKSFDRVANLSGLYNPQEIPDCFIASYACDGEERVGYEVLAGHCHPPEWSEDRHFAIFIHPKESNQLEVAAILAHLAHDGVDSAVDEEEDAEGAGA